VIQSRKASKDVEVYYLVEKGHIVKLSIFHTSIDYLVIASSNRHPYHGVKVSHTNKTRCARMAIRHIYQLIKE
jgi:hypothetical protein